MNAVLEAVPFPDVYEDDEDIQVGETQSYSAASKRRVASEKRHPDNFAGDKRLTADHIPSGRAIKQKAENEALAEAALSNPELQEALNARDQGLMTEEQESLLVDEREKILTRKKLHPSGRGKKKTEANRKYQQALTIFLPQTLHERGRTYQNDNKPLFRADAKDLTQAARLDFERYLEILEADGDLTKQYVAHFTRHYKKLVEAQVVDYSAEINSMLLRYWEKAK